MTMDDTCLNCSEPIGAPLAGNLFDILGDEVRCHACGQRHILCYDESYDPESGIEEGWFFLEKTGAAS